MPEKVEFPEHLKPKPKGPATLRCVCCDAQYHRGSWTCCGPASGQTFSNWSTEWCKKEDGRDASRQRCPRHCLCLDHVASRAGEPLKPATRSKLDALREKLQQPSQRKVYVTPPPPDTSEDTEEKENTGDMEGLGDFLKKQLGF